MAGRLLRDLQSGNVRKPTVPDDVDAEPQITRRELEILRLVSDGLSNKETGKALSITEGTVKNHVHNALEKLHMDNRIQAAAYVVRHGLGRSADTRPGH